MDGDNLVTYMKNSNQKSSGPIDIMISSTDVGIHYLVLRGKKIPSRHLETLTYNQNSVFESERIISRNASSTISTSLAEIHERNVGYYKDQGYQIVNDEIYSDWDSKLIGILDLDLFNLSHEEN